jgi:type II secretory pathway pseudopilin PulG
MKRDHMRDDLQVGRRRAPIQEQGFTLLETAIAFTIMLIVGLAATSLFLYANGYNSGAADRALAIAVARQQLEQLRNEEFTDTLLTIPSGSTSTTSSSTVSNGGKNYTVTKTVELLAACTGCAAAKRITIVVTPQDSTPLWGGTSVSLVTIRSSLTSGSYMK